MNTLPFTPIRFMVARTASDVTDPEHTLGIEITSAEVAAKCHLGNIDEQHGLDRRRRPLLINAQGDVNWLADDPCFVIREMARRGRSISISDGIMLNQLGWCPEEQDALAALPPRAACEVALETVFYHDPPASLATTRPDLDAVAAMAIIMLRSLGWVFPRTQGQHKSAVSATEGFLHPRVASLAAYERVLQISRADIFTPAAEWEPSPLPTLERPWPRAGSVDSHPRLAHLAMICSPRRGDVELPLAERVAIIACWLLFGDPGPEGPWDPYWGGGNGIIDQIYAACGVDEVQNGPLAAICAASSAVWDSRRALAAEAQRPGAIVEVCAALLPGGERCGSPSAEQHCAQCGHGSARPTIAVVRVAHAGALGLGYCVAPVVVAFDQATPGKVAIAAYAAKYIDMAALKARLNALEPGWGGPPTMCCSPSHVGTKLNEQTIVNAVLAACVERG